MWKALKKLTDGESIVAPPNKLTAVHFNKYFSSIGSTTISHLLTTDDNNTENTIFWRGSNCTTRFNFNDIHLEVVRKQLFALGNTSNNDVLGFDSKLLFLGADIIAPILTTFYNASLKPPSHRMRGATTVLGENRHHRSDTASSFSSFSPYPSHPFTAVEPPRDRRRVASLPFRDCTVVLYPVTPEARCHYGF